MNDIEVIINHLPNSSENELDKTLRSLKKHVGNPATVTICIHPPHYFRNLERFVNKLKYYFKNKNLKWNMHLLTTEMCVKDVINFAAEKSKDDYYMFVNSGYKIKDNTADNLKEGPVLFIDPDDDKYNGFICNVKLHKKLLGFGEEYDLIYKIEYKLKELEEWRKNAESKSAEGGSNNL